jgi:hypothetical protein
MPHPALSLAYGLLLGLLLATVWFASTMQTRRSVAVAMHVLRVNAMANPRSQESTSS